MSDPAPSLIRPRLLATLDSGAQRGCTVATAPTGFGKTALLASWRSIGQAPGPVVSVVCEEDDRWPGSFWQHVLDALGDISGALREVPPLARPARPRRVGRDFLRGLALLFRKSGEPVVLVIDESERLGEQVVEELDALARLAAPQLRLVLAGREDPPLPLPRYPAGGQLTRITADDLAFTVDETHQLLEAHGVTVGDTTLSSLVDATEGWPVAVGHAAGVLREQIAPDTEVGRLVAGRVLTDAPLAEILDSQPPDIRAFLLSTCVVDRLWPGLATALSADADAARTLRALVRSNLFVRRAAETGRCYTYTPMFRALLADRLAHDAPGEVVRLHAVAARWLADAGRLTDAAFHRAAAGDWAEAAALVVEDFQLGALLSGTGPLPALFADMPEDAQGAAASAVRAALCMARLDTDGCAAHLAVVERLGRGPSLDDMTPLLVATGLLDVLLAAGGTDVRTGLVDAETVERLLLGQPAALAREHPELHVTLCAGKGTLLLRGGDLDQAAATLTEGVRAARGAGCERARLACLGELALVQAFRGQLACAAEVALAADALADDLGLANGERPCAARVTLAWVRAEEYALTLARSHVRDALEMPGVGRDPVAAGLLTLTQACLARADGDPGGAARIIARFRSQPPDQALPRWLDQRLLGATFWPHGADHDAARATDGEVEPLRTEAQLDLRVEGWLDTAVAELSRAETRRARTALEQALRLAEPERLRRPFAEMPPRLRRFLAADSGLAARRQWLGPIVGVGWRPGRLGDAPPPVVVEPLTEKEREVLAHLSALLSTEEIAASMFVSVNTVKSHVRSILRKLSATRRNEAVRRARELDLINR